jgi:hypothetical protein
MKPSQYLRDAQEIIRNPECYPKYHRYDFKPARYVCNLLDIMALHDPQKYPAETTEFLLNHIKSLLDQRTTLFTWAVDQLPDEEAAKLKDAKNLYTQEFIDWKLAWIDDMIAYFESQNL